MHIDIYGRSLSFTCCALYIGVRLALFRSFCSPMYTSQLWWYYKKCTMKRLLITYHNVFNMSISMSKYESTSLLCTVYNVLCCQAVIRNRVHRFMCRLLASNNSLVMSIQSSSLVYTSRIRKHWRRLLYVKGRFYYHAISVFRVGSFIT